MHFFVAGWDYYLGKAAAHFLPDLLLCRASLDLFPSHWEINLKSACSFYAPGGAVPLDHPHRTTYVFMTMIERELISRIRNPWGDCALVVLLMALALVVTPVNVCCSFMPFARVFFFRLAEISLMAIVQASNVCTCECCDSGSCVHGTNITFAVPTCSDCSKVLLFNFSVSSPFQDMYIVCVHSAKIS